VYQLLVGSSLPGSDNVDDDALPDGRANARAPIVCELRDSSPTVREGAIPRLGVIEFAFDKGRTVSA